MAARAPDRRQGRPAGAAQLLRRSGTTAPEQAKSGEQTPRPAPLDASSQGNGMALGLFELGCCRGGRSGLKALFPAGRCPARGGPESSAGPPIQTLDAEIVGAVFRRLLAQQTHQPQNLQRLQHPGRSLTGQGRSSEQQHNNGTGVAKSTGQCPISAPRPATVPGCPGLPPGQPASRAVVK